MVLKTAFPQRLFAFLLLCAAAPVAALQAQLPKIFVASFGNDANDGSRGSPKRNFQAAHNAVATDGQIVVLDTAGYGALSITKGLTITVPPGVNGFITVSAGTTQAMLINAPGALVTLRGLIVEGGGNKSSQTPQTNYGIHVIACAYLNVEDCTIRNFYDGFFVDGVQLAMAMTRTELLNCRYALDIESTQDVVLTDCKFANNGDGIYAKAGGGVYTLAVSGCVFSSNTRSIRAIGAVTAYVGNSTFGFFDYPDATQATSGYGIYSQGDNHVRPNFGFTAKFTTE